jgi:pimeloyl-ACP methyl ester carboxylesterase
MRAALRAEDGVRIEAEYLPYTGDRQPPPEEGQGQGEGGPGPPVNGAIVLAHGFTGSLEKPALRRAAETFTQHAPVIAFSFRGHGGSGGLSTLGDREVLDLAAAVRWARSLGHDRIATVGFSMGGSVVLRHGGLYRRRESPDSGDLAEEGSGDGVCSPTQAEHGGRTEARTDSDRALTAGSGPAAGSAPEHAAHPDAVIAVSAPARWYYRGTAPMRRLHWVVERPVGRLLGRYGLRTRIHSRSWDPVPLSPVGAAPLIAPAPLLIVHGDLDPYFPLDHPRSLAEAAGPEGAELWLERGFGHAENAAGPALLHRIGAWARARCLALPPARHHGTRNADG